MLNGGALNSHAVNAGSADSIVTIDGWLYGEDPIQLGLSDAAGVAHNDFTDSLTGEESQFYVMDLITSGVPTRIPIKSWQATLQTTNSNYVQCVVPGAQSFVSEITGADSFKLSRVVDIGGVSVEHPMAEAPVEQRPFSRGTRNYSCVISGYSPGFTPTTNPPAVFDRELTGAQTTSTSGGLRVRCEIDFLLRPGHRAYFDGTPLIVDYINYYVLPGQAYMDVGERA